jgi:hypothetical protein
MLGVPAPKVSEAICIAVGELMSKMPMIKKESGTFIDTRSRSSVAFAKEKIELATKKKPTNHTNPFIKRQMLG